MLKLMFLYLYDASSYNLGILGLYYIILFSNVSSLLSLKTHEEIIFYGSDSSAWLLCPNFVRKKVHSEIFISLSLMIHNWMLFSKAVEKKVLVREKWFQYFFRVLCSLQHMQNACKPIPYLCFYIMSSAL